MSYSLQLLEGSIPVLTRTQTLQVLDYTQQPSIPRLEVRLVRYLSVVSCLQVTEAVSGLRDTYTHIPSWATLRQKRAPQVVIVQCGVLLHLPVCCTSVIHSLVIWGQPTHTTYNDLTWYVTVLIMTYPWSRTFLRTIRHTLSMSNINSPKDFFTTEFIIWKMQMLIIKPE